MKPKRNMRVRSAAWTAAARIGLAVAAIVSFASVAEAQAPTQPDRDSFTRPSYQVLRFNEDWSVLARKPADAPPDSFDPVKYMPLDDDEDIWLSLGGGARTRLEGWNNFNFGAPPSERHDDTFLLTRTLFHGDLHV